MSSPYRELQSTMIHIRRILCLLFCKCKSFLIETYRHVLPIIRQIMRQTWHILVSVFVTLKRLLIETYRHIIPVIRQIMRQTWRILVLVFVTLKRLLIETYRHVLPIIRQIIRQTWRILVSVFVTLKHNLSLTSWLPASKRKKTGPSFLLISMILVLLLGMIGSFSGLVIWTHYSKDLPDHATLATYDPATTTRFYAGDGRLLSEFATKRRTFIPITAIPQRLQEAFVAVEDQRFFEHFGLDILGILRAIMVNVHNLAVGQRLVGASTITQQVAKNMLLFSNEQSFARKIREAILAVRIEQVLSKSRILELYLNEIYLGAKSYGVAAAALNYFNKGVDELRLEEIAYLAALPKAPANYHPTRHTSTALIRRNWVLDRMVEENYITLAQAQKAKQQPLITYQRDETEIVRADYFTEEVRRRVLERFIQQEQEEQAQSNAATLDPFQEAEFEAQAIERFYSSGLVVRTTIDPQLQTIAINALRQSLIDYDRRHGLRGPVTHLDSDDWAHRLAGLDRTALLPGWHYAMIHQIMPSDDVIVHFADHSSGTILAAELEWIMNQQEEPESPIQTVSDILSPGDVIIVEPIGPISDRLFTLRQWPEVQGGVIALDPHTGRVLAMTGGFSFLKSQFNRATQARRQPGSAFKPFVALAALENGFTPASIIMDAPFAGGQDDDKSVWRPRNYSRRVYGPITLRIGIEKSRNLMTVRLAHKVGLEKIQEVVTRLRIYDQIKVYPSIALGSFETTLLRLTTAYAMLINGGYQIEPTFIDRIQSRQGEILYRHDRRLCDGCRDVTWIPGMRPPDIPNIRNQIIQSPVAFQVTSILEGVVKRGTGRRLKSLERPMAGKTGTTDNNQDAWFIGVVPDLVVGAYVGFDKPRSLGSRETGASAALPIVKRVLEEWLVDKPITLFRTPPGIHLRRINRSTGLPPKPGDTDVIWEVFLPGTEPTIDHSNSGQFPSQDSKDQTSPIQDDDDVTEITDLDGIY